MGSGISLDTSAIESTHHKQVTGTQIEMRSHLNSYHTLDLPSTLLSPPTTSPRRRRNHNRGSEAVTVPGDASQEDKRHRYAAENQMGIIAKRKFDAFEKPHAHE